MRELTKEEQEMLREEKVTMAKLAREELQYRSAARRWFRDQDRKEMIRIIYKNRKVFAERMDHGDGN